ncbi:MAG: FAD-dependent oxidoreductase [Kiritimatiellae bacterium]|nr:FAD-dependent oxidoreductase [Kiritimatiellia bacterium]
MKRVVIIGGVAGGATAAARLRRVDESAEITILERGPHVSFANCGLPYHVGGVLPDRKSLLVQTAAGLANRFALDVRTGVEATSIDRKAKTVKARRLADGAPLSFPYDELVLAPGAMPVPAKLPGAEEATNIFTLRDIPDASAIRAAAVGPGGAPVPSAVVVGGGFIGLEMAENLREAGVPSVTVVQRGRHVLKTLDLEMAHPVHQALARGGVALLAGAEPVAFEEKGRKVVLKDGRRLEADIVVWAVGVIPESSLARDAGLELNSRGAIVTDDRMRTSDPHIHAVGDAVEILYRPAGIKASIALAGPANKEARVAANDIAGIEDRYTGSLASSVCRVFDTTAATTGLSEEHLAAEKLPYQALHAHPMDRVGWFPGARAISMKLLYNPENGMIWGAQAVGPEGAAKRIDVIAAAMAGGLAVDDLADLDLAYAPPYSAAKDPVNMLGFYAENVRSGLDPIYQWHEVPALQKRGEYLLDVREEGEFAAGAIEGAVNIPLSVLRKRVGEIPRNRPVYLYCQSGVRAHTALRYLRQVGLDARSLDGGYKTWKEATSPVPEPAKPVFAHAPASSAQPAAVNVMKVDARGLQCPGPIVALHKAMMSAKDGEEVEVLATDPGFLRDVESWAKKTGNMLVEAGAQADGSVRALLRRDGAASEPPATAVADGTTIVVFSGELDKAMAALIIATGAAAMGRKVTLFFTFWGLDVLRKANRLPLSRMNLFGLGSAMMRLVMRRKKVDSLPALMEKARSLGVKFMACAMSMDVMGIKKDDLPDGTEVVGVATYLAAAGSSDHNLFI